MPFRLDAEGFPNRSKIQFTTSAEMPHLIYRACLVTDTVSNTVYCQRAIAEALARDLNIPLDRILSELPEPRGPSKHVYERDVSRNQSGGVVRIGPANTDENVR